MEGAKQGLRSLGKMHKALCMFDTASGLGTLLRQLTLAFDHRVCDGGTAGGFLRFVADCVESPVTALGEL